MYMKQNKFDTVMDYIDANITEETDNIKKGIYNEIGYNSNTFGNCFSILTNKTLFHYINERRAFLAAQELIIDKDKTIGDIAMEFGYSEQSSFSRDIKRYFGCTPKDIQKGKKTISDNRYNLRDLCEKNKESTNTRTQRILHDLETKGTLSPQNWELFGYLEFASDEFGFDIDICYEIADLAEKLEIPPERLIRGCYEMQLEEELQSDGQISPKEKVCIYYDIEFEELEDVCRYFNCKYYDIDYGMVEIYKNQQ